MLYIFIFPGSHLQQFYPQWRLCEVAGLALPREAGGGRLSGAGPRPGHQGGDSAPEAAGLGAAEAEGVRGALPRRLSCKCPDLKLFWPIDQLVFFHILLLMIHH